MESAEICIKEMIINRYGSLKKFCERIHMPWTTLDSILKRGIANSNITNVIKITKELKIDTESLVSGIILPSDQIDLSKTENTPEKESLKIIQYYKMLNDIGKKEAAKRVEELTYLPQYKKQQEPDYLAVQAAHNNAETTDEELEKMKRDMELMKKLIK